jgi:hypothetical protein
VPPKTDFSSCFTIFSPIASFVKMAINQKRENAAKMIFKNFITGIQNLIGF